MILTGILWTVCGAAFGFVAGWKVVIHFVSRSVVEGVAVHRCEEHSQVILHTRLPYTNQRYVLPLEASRMVVQDLLDPTHEPVERSILPL